jgi:hypothetical protein
MATDAEQQEKLIQLLASLPADFGTRELGTALLVKKL